MRGFNGKSWKQLFLLDHSSAFLGHEWVLGSRSLELIIICRSNQIFRLLGGFNISWDRRILDDLQNIPTLLKRTDWWYRNVIFMALIISSFYDLLRNLNIRKLMASKSADLWLKIPNTVRSYPTLSEVTPHCPFYGRPDNRISCTYFHIS